MSSPPADSPRPVARRQRRYDPAHRCPECRLHLHVCVCGLLPSLPTRTRVVLLLHQLESRKTTNTGLLALRCLPNSEVVLRGRLLEDGPAEAALPAPAPWTAAFARSVLLFPHPDARPLESFREDGLPLTLVVPDGTWSQAVRARRRMPGLANLPCATLTGAEPAAYRLRHEPRPGRLSTIEAIARALGVLDGPEVERALLEIHRIAVERTLWTNGRLPAHLVTGGIPEGAMPHDPRSGLPRR